jgi:PDZ domain-containing secreted protein
MLAWAAEQVAKHNLLARFLAAGDFCRVVVGVRLHTKSEARVHVECQSKPFGGTRFGEMFAQEIMFSVDEVEHGYQDVIAAKFDTAIAEWKVRFGK